MKVHISNSNFEAGSYAKRCQAFFDDAHQWEPVRKLYVDDNDSLNQVVTRNISRSTDKHLFRIQQYGYEIEVDAPVTHIRHALFRVAMLGIAKVEGDMHELKRWYVINPERETERIAYLKNLTPSTDSVETGDIHQDVRFVLNNSLYVPNRQETYELLDVLENQTNS